MPAAGPPAADPASAALAASGAMPAGQAPVSASQAPVSGGPLGEAELLARLEELGIATRTVRHPPVFTVDEARRLRGELPGGHCKSLFLKDKKDQLWLVVCLEERRPDLKLLQQAIGSARLSFGRPELLWQVLGVRPGSVTPFGLVNDRERRVRPVLDAGMLQRDPLNYHPLRNDATTQIAPADLIRFIAASGHVPLVVDFEPLGAA